MNELLLLCEGSGDSIDVALLTAIFDSVLADANIVIKPSGGSAALGAAAEYLRGQGQGTVAYIRDRDYRPRQQAEVAFADGHTGFFWRRHSIENYLLTPAILSLACTRLQANVVRQRLRAVPAWIMGLPTTTEAVADILRAAARQRTAEEACRLAIHRLWEDLAMTVGQIQKRVPSLTAGSDVQDVVLWRSALGSERERLLNAAVEASQSTHLEMDNLLRRFDDCLALVSAPAYLEANEFLIDFCGGELLNDVLTMLKIGSGRKGFINEYLIAAAAVTYAKDRRVFGTDDFLDLANGVRALANLPPLA